MSAFIVGFLFCLLLLAAVAGFVTYHVVGYVRRNPHRLKGWVNRLDAAPSPPRDHAPAANGSSKSRSNVER